MIWTGNGSLQMKNNITGKPIDANIVRDIDYLLQVRKAPVYSLLHPFLADDWIDGAQNVLSRCRAELLELYHAKLHEL